MRHAPPGLFLLILLGLLLPAACVARAVEPAPAEPRHRPVPVPRVPAPAAHRAAGATAPSGAHSPSPGPAHVAPVHTTSGPARAGFPRPRPARPGSGRPAPVHAPAHALVPPVPAAEPVPAGPDKGSNTGLPLPRWSALRTEEVNLRTGPGTRYPIDWVYKRRDLPVRVEREFDVWRLVALPDGTKGWVSGATLVTHRTFSVVGTAAAPERVMRAAAAEDAPVVARLRPGVIGRIRACDAGAAWCQVQVGEYRGWLRRDAFWGSDPGEAVQ